MLEHYLLAKGHVDMCTYQQCSSNRMPITRPNSSRRLPTEEKMIKSITHFPKKPPATVSFYLPSPSSSRPRRHQVAGLAAVSSSPVREIGPLQFMCVKLERLSFFSNGSSQVAEAAATISEEERRETERGYNGE
ncbi:hypothetical protein Ddye_031863 [Dipteronia dyeriana]|uniref:Uncharacterized protein n=1 Tax=Dipteronia dyeriana TaxID=168575 RepID=A0AAD9TJT3_9ROSI|nr:hypothetical protein Ddye_031863 [Dipteronia dyeriana]